MRKLICLVRGHLDVIHANSIYSEGFVETLTHHYHCERCGRLRNDTRMLRTPRVRRGMPTASPRMGLAVGEVLQCK